MLACFCPSRTAWLAVVAVVLSSGCGGGSDGNRISGKVTFAGKPIPAGKIYFYPDGSKGTTGATGYADIRNGEYDTSAGGVGAVKGTVKVAIEGQDPSAPGETAKGDTSGEVTVKSLFPRWETTLEVTGSMTKDFEVPADAAKRKQVGEQPFVQP